MKPVRPRPSIVVAPLKKQRDAGTGKNHADKTFILTLKTWSSGPGQRRLAVPESYAVELWNIGMLEYWVGRIGIFFTWVSSTNK